MNVSPCPNCGGRELYGTKASAGGGHAPNYLPGLGGFWMTAKFELVLCRDCGLTRFFASRDAMEKVANSKKWKRMDGST